MEAGSITFSTELDNTDLEKELNDLTKKIEKTEKDILKITEKRDRAQGVLDSGELEAEKKKLEEMKAAREKYLEASKKIVSLREKEESLTADIAQKEKDRADAVQQRSEILERLAVAEGRLGNLENAPIKDRGKIKEQKEEVRILAREMSKLDSTVQKYDAGIKKSTESLEKQKSVLPQLVQQLDSTAPSKEKVDAQSEKVKKLQSEWTQAKKEVKRYSDQLSDAEKELDRQKQEAGYIVKKLQEEETAAGDMSGLLGRAEERLSSILEKLQQQQSAAVEANKALGGVVDTQTKLTGLAKEFALGAKIGLVGIAKAAVQAAGSIRQGVPGALKSAASAVSGFAKGAISKIPALMQNAFSRSAKFVGEFGKKIIGVVKNMNAFSKLSDGLSQKFKRLGSTIKQALVFSVIYKGLATVREQMGAYLAVNTQFSTALRQLSGVLLTAFQPIYDTVLPALTDLTNGVARAVAAVSQFTARLFGTTAKQSQKSAEALYNEANALEAAGSAAEDAAGSLAGFDEINSIQTENKGGGGGASGAESGPLFDYEYEDQPFDSWGEAFSGFLDKILGGIPKLRDAFKSFADWLNDFNQKLYDMFTFPGVLDKVKQLGRDLADALNDLVNQINWELWGRALGAGLNLALNFLTSFLYEFDWMNLGQHLAYFINGLVDEIDWYEFGRLLWAGFKIAIETLAGLILGLNMPLMAESASNIVMGFFDSMTETLQSIPWDQIGLQIAAFLTGLDWSGMFASVYNAITAALEAIRGFLVGFLSGLGEWTHPLIDIVNTIIDTIEKMMEVTREWVSRVDFSPIEGAFESVSTAVSNLVDVLSEGLLWAYENVLLPLAGWVVEDAAPATVNSLSKEFELITAVLEPLIGIFKLLWDQVLQPFVEWIESSAVVIIEGLGSIFEKVADVFQSKGEQIETVVSLVMELISAMWEQSRPVLEGLRDLVENVFKFVGDVIGTVVGSAIDVLSGLIDFIEGVFSGDWEKAWDGISSVFKGIWNGIVGTLEAAVNFIIRGINSLVTQLNKVSFEVPDWVPSIGGKTFGFNVPSIPEIQIPRLAQGAVIPPNREFMAVLGDQRNGNNLEGPESLFRQIVRDESGGGAELAEIVQLLQSLLNAVKEGHVITVDGQTFGRTAIKTINSVNGAAGKQLLKI